MVLGQWRIQNCVQNKWIRLAELTRIGWDRTSVWGFAFSHECVVVFMYGMPIMGHNTNINNLRPNPNTSPFYPQRTPKPELRLNPNANNFHPDSTIPITPPTIRDLIQYYGNLSTDHKNLSNIWNHWRNLWNSQSPYHQRRQPPKCEMWMLYSIVLYCKIIIN